MSTDLLARLIAAGTPADLIAEVAMLAARADADREAIETRRSKDRARQADRRNVMSRDIVDVADVTDTPPALDKETSPRPPKEINPTPRPTRGSALARKAGGFGPPNGVNLSTWNAFCQQRKKAVSEIAYHRMLNTLAEAADAGWPPGEVVERSIEKTWETLFVPKEHRNGQRNGHHGKQDTSGLGRTIDAGLDFIADGRSH